MAGEQRDVVVGLDVGTTSTKAVAFGVDARARVGAQRAYPLRTPAPGRAEQDAEAVADAAIDATAEVVRAARVRGLRVAGLCLSAAMHCIVGLDAAGRARTPLVTWADRRATGQAARLRAGPEALALHRRTGTPVHPMSPLVKLRWFAEHEPATFASVRSWVGIKELVVRRLCDELVVDHGVASATGLFDLREERWDPEALAWAGVRPDQLPELVPTTAALPLSAGGGALLGLDAGTPLVVGSSDGPLANLGLGAIREGAAACSIGTSGAVRVVADAPHVDERGRVFCYVLARGRWVVGGAVNNGGVVLDWCADALAPELAAQAREAGRSVPQALLAVAGEAPAGSDGLLFLPFLLGERAPHWTGSPRACFVGLTREHRREHLLRAVIEGVCLQLAVVLASLGEAGIEVREVRATGGFSRSALWRRILAGAFGRPLAFAASPEGSSLGAALLGMTELGMLDSLDRAAELVAVTSTQEPDGAEAERYARLLPVFDAAYDALEPTFRALAELTPPSP